MRSIPRVMRLLVYAGFYVGLAALLASSAPSAPWAEGRVHSTPEAVQPLSVGARVPSARVESVRGEPVDLAEVVRKHGALIVFYRGGW